VVLVTADKARELNLENPQGTMVSYNGKLVSVQL